MFFSISSTAFRSVQSKHTGLQQHAALHLYTSTISGWIELKDVTHHSHKAGEIRNRHEKAANGFPRVRLHILKMHSVHVMDHLAAFFLIEKPIFVLKLSGFSWIHLEKMDMPLHAGDGMERT
jgi:hypothetical protein